MCGWSFVATGGDLNQAQSPVQWVGETGMLADPPGHSRAACASGPPVLRRERRSRRRTRAWRPWHRGCRAQSRSSQLCRPEPRGSEPVSPGSERGQQLEGGAVGGTDRAEVPVIDRRGVGERVEERSLDCGSGLDLEEATSVTIGAGTMIGQRNRQNSAVHASWCLSLALSIGTGGPVSANSIGVLRELLAQDLLGALGQIRRAIEQADEEEVPHRLVS